MQVQTMMDQMNLESEKKLLAMEAEKLSLQNQLRITFDKKESLSSELTQAKVNFHVLFFGYEVLRFPGNEPCV